MLLVVQVVEVLVTLEAENLLKAHEDRVLVLG